MDYSPPSSSVHGIFHRRILECGLFPNQESNPHLLHWQAFFFFYHWATWEALLKTVIPYTPLRGIWSVNITCYLILKPGFKSWLCHFLKNNLTDWLRLCWVFIASGGFSLVLVSRGYSWLWYAGFSMRWLLLLWSTGSRHSDFSSCSSRALEVGSRAQAQ